MSVTFRLATPADQPRIVAIYNEAIATKQSTADLTPMTVAERQPWFREFDSHHFSLWVIVHENQVVGYVGLEPYSDRAAYSQTAEIALYLAAEAQGMHVGSQTHSTGWLKSLLTVKLRQLFLASLGITRRAADYLRRRAMNGGATCQPSLIWRDFQRTWKSTVGIS